MRLKAVLESHLNDTRVIADGRSDVAECGRSKRQPRLGEMSFVEDIENLETEVRMLRLGDSEDLEDGSIRRIETRSYDCTARFVA